MRLTMLAAISLPVYICAPPAASSSSRLANRVPRCHFAASAQSWSPVVQIVAPCRQAPPPPWVRPC